MLVLPPEASCSQSAVGVRKHRDTDEGALLGQRLSVADGPQRLVGDALDEAVAQRVERRPESSNLLSERYTLLDRRVNRAVVDERAAGRVEEAAVGDMPGSQLGDLADRACDRVLVAFAARLSVVNGTETIRYLLDVLERRLCFVELDLTDKPVGQIVEAGRGLGCG